MIEWLPGEFTGGIESVDAKTRSIRTSGELFKADVANIIPPQIAGELAHRAGLTDSSGWCPVDPQSFESTLHPGIHLVGDAIASGQMPKSAFAANSQAKACAFAIASALTGAEASRLFLFNSCYTFLAPDDAVSDGISFKAAGGKIAIADIEISRLDESQAVRAQSVREAEDWYAAFTRDVFG